MSIKTGMSIAQYLSKMLGRPVGRGESATKVQQEVLEKQNRAGARSVSKPIKVLPTDSKMLKRKIINFNKSVKAGKPVIDERLEDLLRKERMKNKNKDKFLVGGQAKIDANKDGKISGEDFKILREKNKKKKGGVTSAIKKIRGIGMAKGGFKSKTPIY
tara:strand:- start:284 stop:760 length:477 start_codon:yes stop_codon:yes gene_type:complete